MAGWSHLIQLFIGFHLGSTNNRHFVWLNHLKENIETTVMNNANANPRYNQVYLGDESLRQKLEINDVAKF